MGMLSQGVLAASACALQVLWRARDHHMLLQKKIAGLIAFEMYKLCEYVAAFGAWGLRYHL